jgi:hypothetical protein
MKWENILKKIFRTITQTIERGNPMKIIKKSLFIGLIILMTGLACLISQAYAQGLFYEYQPMPTQGADDWESFTIGSDIFLAVANYHNGSSYNINSKIYIWNGDEFELFQAIPTNGAVDWESFTIGSDTFLAVANHYNGSTYNIDSKIYIWNGDKFELFQAIPTNGAFDWESFTIGPDTFLAVANHRNDSTYNINSRIYKWDGVSFVEFQPIPTHGACDWECFTIGSDTFLAVANFSDDTSRNIDSRIYKWDGVSFVEFQPIPTHGALDWESFTIGSDIFLAVANCHNNSTFNIDSKIYKWNGSFFVEFQSIPTNGARDWESFTIGSDIFLAVANYHNGSTYNTDSKIYIWNGIDFEEFQSIPTNGTQDWESFTIDTDIFLAVANRRNNSTKKINSKIYKWNGNAFVEEHSILTRGALDWEYFTIGSDIFLAVANHRNGSIYNIDSKIYIWNGSFFVEFQSIPTHMATDWESFTIGPDTFLVVANCYNGSIYNIDSKIYKWNGSFFVEFQSIPTQGAYDWESFTIGSDTFLAVANSRNNSTYNIDSKIYIWKGDKNEFEPFQSIPTHRALDWECFTIGSYTFLAVANQRNSSTYNIDSKIYIWNGSFFVEFQSIHTNGATDWESFVIGPDTFLAVANHYNGSTRNIDSKIYKWDGNEKKFDLFQPIPTNGATDWESFTIGSDTFLAVANCYNNSTYNINSKIYIWNGNENEFELFQSIPTQGGYDWESFTIGCDTFLAVANYYNGSKYNIDSKIYKNICRECNASRSAPGYAPCSFSTIKIDVIPDAQTATYAVEDTPPEEWQVSDINEGGKWDSVNKKVKWGPFFDNTSRTLTYKVKAPCDANGCYPISGSASFNGVNQSICGDDKTCPGITHPADTYRDWRLAISEVTGYGAAWKKGEEWPVDPNPIPISYVTRAGYIWKQGESYHYILEQSPPLCWELATTQTAARKRIMSDTQTLNHSFDPSSYLPGQQVNVMIEVIPAQSTAAYALEDTPPDGWYVSDINEGGTWDSVNKKVKWGPFFDNQQRTVTYKVTPPPDGSGTKGFHGVYSANGTDFSIDRQIPEYVVPCVEEICDGKDNDCDGEIDEDLTRTTTCGMGECTGNTGIETCNAGIWTGDTCDPLAGSITEECDTLDNDCDGLVDEELVQDCSNECGQGTETCEDGQWVNCTAPPPPCEGGCNATRSALGYAPGSSVTIIIDVIPDSQTSVYAVEDTPPDGWLVSDINESGTWDSVNKKVKWGPFFDNTSRTLTYNVEAPSDANGCYSLSGYASFDDVNQSICGDAEICDGMMNLSKGWSMISLPVIPDNAKLSALFPEAVVMYMYERGAGYVRVKGDDDLEASRGYWILLNDAQSYSINGQLIQEYILSAYEDGWEMIGGCGSPAQASVDHCNIGVIYGFDNETGYKRIPDGECLEPGKGYWIFIENTTYESRISVTVDFQCIQ